MNNPSLFAIACLAFCFGSCASNSEHEGFSSVGDCIVYQNEVTTENFNFGRVESIDTTKANRCAKQHLSNAYLLYINSICVTVYNEHPKKDIDFIKTFVKEFQTDSTRLSSFVRSDSSITIVVDRLCKDSTNDVRYGQYVDWREIEYTTSLNKKRDDLITMWYSWKE